MIRIKTITARNFLSIGNNTQAVDFDRRDLTLVLGENLDLGGDGARNGVGKTAILNAVSYALYGQALTNIRKDNLINRTNGKNMFVSLDFAINGRDYRIERGRKPNVLKFYVDSEEQVAVDEAQGDSRETQSDIERILGMPLDMFRHIVALNTYTEPFLSLKANDQRVIIEQLLGITLLSERADKIRELNRSTKEAITQEEFRIRAVSEANKRIEEQIESLRKRQRMWITKRDDDVAKLAQAIADLEHIDIDAEVQAHRDLEIFHAKKKSIDDATKWIRSIDADNSKIEKQVNQIRQDLVEISNHKCFACGTEIHDNSLDTVKEQRQKTLQEHALQLLANQSQRLEHEDKLKELGPIGTAPVVFYDTLEDALNHRNSLETLRKDLSSRQSDVDTYKEQIEEMQGQALQVITYDTLNALTRLQEHQDFLLKLLTSKDSFVRKKIIDQNLSYLNSRLTHYLDRIGLPHQVVFQNDLTVEITELGRELDFDNLSRGERNRLILGISWAFRDVWESLYQPINVLFVDEMIDSGMDTVGVESALGVLKQMARERNKSIWLVSHKDELASRVENTLRVIKENGFTSYSNDIDTNSI
jgi:DNA repair exonuclease SbcCD ATPase subunit